jgi:hypothetical protein
MLKRIAGLEPATRLRIGIALLTASALAAGALVVFQPRGSASDEAAFAPVDPASASSNPGRTPGSSTATTATTASGTPGTTSPSPSPQTTSTATRPPTTRPTTSAPGPAAPVALGCMPRPSACGWPDETNTGVPAGAALTTRSGEWRITQPGTYSGYDVAGCIYVEASNVVIRNTRVRGDCWYSIRTGGSATNLVVEDTEIVLSAGLEGSYGICCSNFTLNRVHIHNHPNGNQGADCVYLGHNNVVRDSYCVVGRLNAGSPGHADGFQSDGGGNYTLEHNTIRNPNDQTSAILMSTNSGPISNVIIRDNLVAGGGYTIYCGTDSGGVSSGLTFSGNRFARTYYSRSGYWGPITSCSGSAGNGNIWDDTGQPV